MIHRSTTCSDDLWYNYAKLIASSHLLQYTWSCTHTLPFFQSQWSKMLWSKGQGNNFTLSKFDPDTIGYKTNLEVLKLQTISLNLSPNKTLWEARLHPILLTACLTHINQWQVDCVLNLSVVSRSQPLPVQATALALGGAGYARLTWV